ncbi:hypothetical protein F5Y01DRAFT_311947 [Xylaria sp. FL0043]|nr:hypothetical protein F5Y01DRAFT_311947 [Xylaria sp. FL0043]
MSFSSVGGFLLLFVVLGTTTGIVPPVLGERSNSEATALLEQRRQHNSHVVMHSSPSLSPEHVFYANSQANFSWDDPELRRRLWSGQPEMAQKEGLLMPTFTTKKQHLEKRAGSPRVLGTLFKIPSCLGCARAQNGGPKGTISELTESYLEGVLLKTDAELYNTCLFYTSVWGASDQLQITKIGPWYTGTKPPVNLSKPATSYGCMNGLITIWNCFSGGNDVTGASNNPKEYNYWEVDVPGTWLYDGLYIQGLGPGLDVQVNIRMYFENMSAAFAKHCGGTVRVMSLAPTNLGKYPNIWGNKELPALRANLNSPSKYRPVNLIAIDATDPTMQYMIDWTTLAATKILSKDDPLYYDPAQFPRRDTCDSNVNYQLDGQDWFG